MIKVFSWNKLNAFVTDFYILFDKKYFQFTIYLIPFLLSIYKTVYIIWKTILLWYFFHNISDMTVPFNILVSILRNFTIKYSRCSNYVRAGSSCCPDSHWGSLWCWEHGSRTCLGSTCCYQRSWPAPSPWCRWSPSPPS